MQRVSPLDAAWLAIESRDTPMHVGGLFEFTLPADAPAGYLERLFAEMREVRAVPPPWNLELLELPLLGSRLPAMRQVHDVDLDYHVRHSALPHPGGQRELGVLVSRLHSNELDLHRPLWEVHLIEGLERNRFAVYTKMHHSLVDGVSGMRLILRTLSSDPRERGTPSFWTVGAGERPREDRAAANGPLGLAFGLLRESAAAAGGVSRAALDLAVAAVDERPLQAPYRAPDSALGGRLGGQRRFATQQYEFARVKRIARAFDCTLNDLVLYLSSTALRHYLLEHARLPERSLTAGIPVNLRDARDESMGTAIAMMVAELATNVAESGRAPARDRPLDDGGQAPPQPPAARGAHLLHAAAQRPLCGGAADRTGGSRARAVQRGDLQRARSDRAALHERLAARLGVPAVAAHARQRLEHHLRELCGNAQLRLHGRARHDAPPAASGDLHGRGAGGDRGTGAEAAGDAAQEAARARAKAARKPSAKSPRRAPRGERPRRGGARRAARVERRAGRSGATGSGEPCPVSRRRRRAQRPSRPAALVRRRRRAPRRRPTALRRP